MVAHLPPPSRPEPLPGEFELVAGPGRTLILRDAQHEYVFQPTPE